MTKKQKIIIATLIFIIVILSIVLYILAVGPFILDDLKMREKEVAAFESPDGLYTLKYIQFGEPDFPFGNTYVQLVIYDSSRNRVALRNSFISDDGCNACKENIKEIKWEEGKVTVILQASEMEDKTETIEYGK